MSTHYDELYRTGGFRYEARREVWEDWVARHYVDAFDLTPDDALLDIPCGDGFWSSVFAKFGFRVTGADLSPGGVEIARQRYPGIEFVVANAEEPLPFPDQSFDVVFSRGITHLHRRELLTDASRRMARNLMRYVRPGGLLLVSYNTRRDGTGGESKHTHHPVSALVNLFESAGDVYRVEVVGNFVQIGVQHRDAPRRVARGAPAARG